MEISSGRKGKDTELGKFTVHTIESVAHNAFLARFERPIAGAKSNGYGQASDRRE